MPATCERRALSQSSSGHLSAAELLVKEREGGEAERRVRAGGGGWKSSPPAGGAEQSDEDLGGDCPSEGLLCPFLVSSSWVSSKSPGAQVPEGQRRYLLKSVPGTLTHTCCVFTGCPVHTGARSRTRSSMVVQEQGPGKVGGSRCPAATTPGNKATQVSSARLEDTSSAPALCTHHPRSSPCLPPCIPLCPPPPPPAPFPRQSPHCCLGLFFS